MIFVLDNYDSFVYNLVQYLGVLGQELMVCRNDVISVESVGSMNPSAILVSPGPCTPKEAGISMDLIRKYAGRIPIMGVCLGHQSIGEVFGGQIIRAPRVMHGKVSSIRHDGKSIFQGIENPFDATRYHSLIIDRDSLPDCLEVTAQDDNGVIMGVRHRSFLVEGVQFHPESVLTKVGMQILRNFLKIAGIKAQEMNA
ncbi:aminodeoxychorismate/anthranilate synthase component II [bacterium]|nr:aminodeoxychorismate/anthranilate synthase component II [bacterium]